ncbi:MAG: sulfatase, partial [Planctomycetota bacterium]
NAVTMPQHFASYGGYRTESLGKVFHIGHGNLGDADSFSVPHFKEKVIEYVDPESTGGGKLTREEAFFTNQRLGEIKSLPRGAAFESPDVPDMRYADGRVAEETLRRLRAAKQRRAQDGTPFFIAVGFARPHLPFSAPKKYWDLHDPDSLPLPEFEELPSGSPDVAGKRGGEITNYKPIPTQRDAKYDTSLKRKLIHGYYASTSYVDAQIGRVLDELDRLELTQQTIIVLWGDHGFHLGDLGIWTKHTNYEQANRIPILISAPDVAASGTSTSQPATSVDIFPTLAELAGLPAPSGPQPIDGVSLVPVLKDPKARVRNHAYHAYPKRKLGRAIRTERYRMVEWKSIEGDGPAEYELYDYQVDPRERKNLATQQPEVLAEHIAILAKYDKPVPRTPRKSTSKPVAVPTQKVATPKIANRHLTITGKVQTDDRQGVIVAQGGREHGYAVHLVNERLAFDVRVDGNVRRVRLEKPAPSSFSFRAYLDDQVMSIAINDQAPFTRPSPGLIPSEPQDALSVKRDERTAAGNYAAPNELDGEVTDLSVDVSAVIERAASNVPFQSDLITRWGKEVTAENAWSEYPRPQLRRSRWTN